MMRTYSIILKVIGLFLFQIAATHIALGQQNKATFVRVSPNTYSPSLYSQKINLQIMLVNLPGADTKGSSLQGSYKMYFMPEGVIEKLAQSKGGVIDQINPNDISNKILLNSGSFSKPSLNSNRYFEKIGIPFKSKVPDKSRTMLGNIVIFYTIKVYDAKLKKNVYKDSSFIYAPFDRADTNSPRITFHLSFFVNENGKLYDSSVPRDKSSTSW